jgi:hypothetical protein
VKGAAMKSFTVVGVVLLFAATASAADKVEVPFLFTEDQAVAPSDLQRNLGSSDALRSDPYLTTPLNRLEYMLTRLETRLNDELTITIIKKQLRERFEAGRPPFDEQKVEGFVRYSDEQGKIIAGYNVEHLGRPRIPMRTACDKLLDTVSWALPQELLGFLYHNTALGVLQQKSFDQYTTPLQKLASNVVHRVTISSMTETQNDNVHHGLRCQRVAKDSRILYDKFSFKNRRP